MNARAKAMRAKTVMQEISIGKPLFAKTSFGDLEAPGMLQERKCVPLPCRFSIAKQSQPAPRPSGTVRCRVISTFSSSTQIWVNQSKTLMSSKSLSRRWCEPTPPFLPETRKSQNRRSGEGRVEQLCGDHRRLRGEENEGQRKLLPTNEVIGGGVAAKSPQSCRFIQKRFTPTDAKSSEAGDYRWE